MNIEKLLSLLGHTSTSDSFKYFLLENGINRFPKGDFTTRIKTKDKLISMEFDPTDSYKEKYLSQPIGDGGFTFESIDINKGFEEEIPFKLDFTMDKSQVEEKLGKSVSKNKEDLVQIYQKETYIVILFYKNKWKGIETIRIRKMNKFDENNLSLK
ncbi:hypothetical protein I6G66_03680 [Delftia acidovorans]|uniref:Uncharacterized protein n=1 Tax=Delftia acidovorans TaxID=80866 RepID=A0A7T2W0F8_DELAC|nr:hypothetical protein [Delftia acidovorans]QPS09163.1 hypothetical protein I6G66_03680 [Delftia acidovorans]